MSIILDAIKKIEARRGGLISAKGTHPLPSKTPGRFSTVILSILIVVSVSALTVFLLSKRQHIGVKVGLTAPGPGQHTGKASKESGLPPQMVAQTEQTAGSDQAWTDVKAYELFRLGRYTEAAVEFEHGVKREPQNKTYHNNLGLAYFYAGRNAEAEEAFKKALAIDPKYAEALNNYGGLLAQRGDHTGAIKKFKAAYGARPDYPAARLNSAISHELSGEIDSAIEEYERFLSSSDAARDAEKALEVRKKLMHLRSAEIMKDAANASR